MNLVIDIGNTRTKVGIYQQSQLLQHWIAPHLQDILQYSDFQEYISYIRFIILSDVAHTDIERLIQITFTHAKIYILSTNLPLPFDVLYDTPHTLGSDRLASVAQAIDEFSTPYIIVIDAGTCIKYNIIQHRAFVGGAISPGIEMRYKALHHFTGKLPLLHLEKNYQPLPPLIGKNTHQNLHSGVLYGCVAEVNYYIHQISSLYQQDEMCVVLTGGDAVFFEKVLGRKVFLRPYLILDGLNRILEYQHQI